jgi:hypothetical protein
MDLEGDEPLVLVFCGEILWRFWVGQAPTCPNSWMRYVCQGALDVGLPMEFNGLGQ